MNEKPTSPSRRDFLQRTGVAGAAALLPVGVALAGQHGVTERPMTQGAPLGHAHDAKLRPQAFYLLPTGAITPRGWLRRQLEIQAAGLGGHLDETWPDVGPDSGWLGGKGESWERGPYFLDGLVPLAWQLDSDELKAKALRFLD